MKLKIQVFWDVSVAGRVVANVSKDHMRALGSVETHETTPCHITDDLSPQQRRWENLKSGKNKVMLFITTP
jgi:hypothetical protein